MAEESAAAEDANAENLYIMGMEIFNVCCLDKIHIMSYVFRYVTKVIMEQKLVFYVGKKLIVNKAYLISIMVIHISVLPL